MLPETRWLDKEIRHGPTLRRPPALHKVGIVRYRDGLRFWVPIAVTAFAEALVSTLLSGAGGGTALRFGLGAALLSGPLAYGARWLLRGRLNGSAPTEMTETALDATEAVVVVLDSEGRIVRVNRACERMTGQHQPAMVGRFAWDVLFGADDVDAARSVFDRALAGDMPVRHESSCVAQSGPPRRVAWSYAAVPDGAGTARFVVATGVDITERRRMERERRQFELGISRSNDVVFLTDTDGRIVYVNPAFERTYGYTREEAVGQTPRVIKSGVLGPEVYEAFWSALLGKETVSGEITNRKKDGQLVIVESTANPVLDETGEILGFLAIQRDVTDRKRTEEALVASERRFRTLTERVPEGVGVVSVDGQVLYANSAICNMLGYSKEEFVGRRVGEFQHPADRERAGTRFRAVFNDPGELPPEEYRLVHKAGHILPVEISSRVIEFEGRPAMLSTMRDLSGQRQLEEQLRQSQKMEAVGQLAGGIAHDFNNLLTVILAGSELIADSLPPDAPELRADLREVRAAVMRGKELIGKLLAFSRRGELEFRPLAVDWLVREFRPTLRRLLPEHIDIRLETAPSVPRARADAGSIEQILMNLCSNASNAMVDGGVLTVEIGPARLTLDDVPSHGDPIAGDFVCLSVTDTGTGMDDRTREKLFEPFFTTRAMGGGTGLGSAVVHGLVSQHRGSINVHSRVDEGTTIQVFLPIATDGGSASQARVGRAELPRGTETVLVVEDEPALRRAARRTLERLGYRVLLAEHGEDALAVYAASDGIDLVLSDVIMPKLGGRGLYDALRAGGSTVKFLFCSGYTAGDLAERSRIASQFPFLSKPWTLTELAQKVREVLDAD
jgi:PAS domain S-box-containing protein